MPILLGADVHTRERSGLSAPLRSAQRRHYRRGNRCEADIPYRLRPSLAVRRYETVRMVPPSMTYFIPADDPRPRRRRPQTRSTLLRPFHGIWTREAILQFKKVIQNPKGSAMGPST